MTSDEISKEYLKGGKETFESTMLLFAEKISILNGFQGNLKLACHGIDEDIGLETLPKTLQEIKPYMVPSMAFAFHVYLNSYFQEGVIGN